LQRQRTTQTERLSHAGIAGRASETRTMSHGRSPLPLHARTNLRQPVGSVDIEHKKALSILARLAVPSRSLQLCGPISRRRLGPVLNRRGHMAAVNAVCERIDDLSSYAELLKE
jgi:hypothetical protein